MTPEAFVDAVITVAEALKPIGRVCGGLSIIGASPELIAAARAMPGAEYRGYGHRDRKGLGYLTVPIRDARIPAITLHDVPAPVKLPKLTGPHRFALRALADGLPHEGGPATANGLIRGVSAAALVAHGYATGVGSGPVRYTITAAGRAALVDPPAERPTP